MPMLINATDCGKFLKAEYESGTCIRLTFFLQILISFILYYLKIFVSGEANSVCVCACSGAFNL